MIRYGNAHNLDFAREHGRFFDLLVERTGRELGRLEGRRCLDLGCGKSFWLTLLLHSLGAEATGIDPEVARPGRSPAKYLSILRSNGPERSLRTLWWDLTYSRPYYRELERCCGFPLRFQGLDLRPMSAAELDFPPAGFDLAVSHEVFEHLPRVDLVLRSLRRVLKPDGLAYIYIHNFASLSGGHHIAWKYPDTEPSREVPAWDHLRENRFPEIPSWINRLRMTDFRAAFEAEFEILAWLPGDREGEALLTPELREELAAYSAEELLTKGFTVIARPRARGSGPEPSPKNGRPPASDPPRPGRTRP